MIKVRKDLTGMRFGKLVVINQNEKDYIAPSGRKAALWNCLCDCGNSHIANGWYLTKGDTTSCGCINKEIVAARGSEMWSKFNRYDLSGEYGIGYTDKEEEFWFDLEDYEMIKDYYWSYNTSGYVCTHPTNGSEIKLHRLVMKADKDETIDHKDHPPRKAHKVDNRKSNLRVATDSQNSMNRHTHINNTTGVKGVYWHKQHNKWQAAICVNRKQIFLGYYEKKEEAIKAREAAEKKYFGEWNFQKEVS